MLRNKTLSVLTVSLLAFASAASAEMRYFEFTGTATASGDQKAAPAGTKISGRFSYDDATAGDLVVPSYMLYEIPTMTVGSFGKHSVVTERTHVTLIDRDGGGDMVDVYGTGEVLLDDKFHPYGAFGFRMFGTQSDALVGTALPASFDMAKFSPDVGFLQLYDQDPSLVVEFTLDDIVSVGPPTECLKKNGKPDKKCKHQP
jgi:hypothetical protein